MSYYADLDVSIKTTSIAIFNEKGKICFETICETDPEIIAKTLRDSGCILEKIGLESGCLSFWLVEELKKHALPVICIESKQMATIIALKVNKTDRNDARLIANAMRCNLYKEVFHKTKESVEVGLQMGTRRVLVDTRTKLKNSVCGFLKTYGIRLGAISHEKFSETVRSALQGINTGCSKIFLKHAENIFLSEGARCLTLRCRMQHCLAQLFEPVYWMERNKYV